MTLVAVLVLTALSALVLIVPKPAAASDYIFDQEQTVTGNCDGISGSQTEDGSFQTCTEADTDPDETTNPGSEFITHAVNVSGTFPGSVQTSDDDRLVKDEQLVTTQDDKDYPDTETLNGHPTEGGTFPTSLESNDDVLLNRSEKSSTAFANYTASAQSILKGSQTAGSFPTCAEGSEDTRCSYAEADQAAAPSDLLVDTETITNGTKVSGDSPPTPSDVDSDNAATITYREANQGGTQTLAFDAVTGSNRTLTTDPWTWSHNPVGTARGIVVAIGHGTESTDCIASVTYAGATMSRVISAADTATEAGRVYLYFLGSSIPTNDPATVSADIAAAGACSTTDMEFVSITYTANADTEVLDSDSDAENQANPTATLQYVGREALAVMVFYSGIADVSTATSACSGSSACNYDHHFDIAAFGSRVDQQTTRGSTDQVMGYTVANDDVAVGYVAITQVDSAPDYELTIKYSWSTEACGATTRLTVNGWHTNTESFFVQVYDSGEANPTTRLTITATADGTTLTYDLSADEFDSGNPDIRFIGDTESGDATQTDLILDYVVVRCITTPDFEVELRYDFSGIPTAGTEWRLFIEGRQGVSNPESIWMRIYASDETGLSSVVCTFNTTTEAEYDCGSLSGDQLDGGTPNILFHDENQTDEGSQSSFDIDRVRIQRTFTTYTFDFIQYDWTGTVTLADTLTLWLRVLRDGDTENPHIDLWDWEDSDWNEERLNLTSSTEQLISVGLQFGCGAGADNCERSGTSDVRIRVHNATADETQTTMRVDEMWVQIFNDEYMLEVSYAFSAVSPCEVCRLTIEANRTEDTETINVDVFTPSFGWTTRLTVTTDAEATQTYDLNSTEYNATNPTIRFKDAGGVGGGTTRLAMDLISITSITVSDALEVRKNSTGITANLQQLKFKGNITGLENFDVYVWNATSATWDLKMDSVFTTTNEFHNVGLAQDYKNVSNVVAIRIVDDDTLDNGPTDQLKIDYLAVQAFSNTAPTITDGGSMTEDSVAHTAFYEQDFNATDPDIGQTLTWSVVSDSTGIFIGSSNGTVYGAEGTPADYYVNVTVDDGNGGNDYVNYTLHVTNADPIITPDLATDTASENAPYSRDFDIADPDHAWNGTAGMVTNASFLSFNTTTYVVNGTPPVDVYPQTFYVNVSATDDHGAVDYVNYTLTVTEDLPPTLTNLTATPQPAFIDSQITVRVNYTDSGNETPAYIYANVSGTNYTLVKEDPNDFDFRDGVWYVNVSGPGYLRGWHNYNATANDGFNPDVQTSTEQFLVSNRLPVITTDPVTSVEVNTTYYYDVNSTDPDLDTPSYTMVTDAVGLSIEPTTGVVNGTILTSGTYYVNVTVDDGFGGTDYQNYTLTVTDPPTPPPPEDTSGVTAFYTFGAMLGTLAMLGALLGMLKKRDKKEGRHRRG